MSGSPDVLARYAEAWTTISHALLIAAGWMPGARVDGPWRDTTTDRTMPEALALDEARRSCERDPDLRHHAKALDTIEETMLREAGWFVTAAKGGIAWREMDGKDTHTRAEGAAIVRQRLAEAGR